MVLQFFLLQKYFLFFTEKINLLNKFFLHFGLKALNFLLQKFCRSLFWNINYKQTPAEYGTLLFCSPSIFWRNSFLKSLIPNKTRWPVYVRSHMMFRTKLIYIFDLIANQMEKKQNWILSLKQSLHNLSTNWIIKYHALLHGQWDLTSKRLRDKKQISKNKNFTAKTEYLNLKAHSNNVKMQTDKI